MTDRPNFYIIAGCNGAGKTTASYTVLPEVLDCREYVNADEIARGLSPFNPKEMAIEAGRLMIDRMENLIRARESFSIETTLATRYYSKIIRRAQKAGYVVTLLFFWLPSPEMAQERVRYRVATGGHDIPAQVIQRRYWLGLQYLFEIYTPIVDRWSLYDNTQAMSPIVVRNTVVDAPKLQKIKELCLNQKK